MENENFFSTVKDMVQDYAEERLLLLRLQATEKAAKASSTLFIGGIVAAISLVIFLIVSGIAGYYLSQVVGSYAAGFGILAGAYVLLIFLLLFIHKRYTARIVTDSVIRFSLSQKDTFTHEV